MIAGGGPLKHAGLLALAAAAATAQFDTLNQPGDINCRSYVVSGPDPGYFTEHSFWDFRYVPNLDNFGTVSYDDFTLAPPLVTADQDSGAEPVTSFFFNATSTWRDEWRIVNGTQNPGGSPDAPVRSVNSAANVYILRNSTVGDGNEHLSFLTLRASRLPDFMSIAEVDSLQDNVLHASVRAYMRVLPNGPSSPPFPDTGLSSPVANPDTGNAVDDPGAGSSADHPVDAGAVVGFFMYHSDTQESDVEILTAEGTSYIHYSNQPDYDAARDEPVAGASSNVTLPDGKAWTDWHEYRMDWFDGVSRWYVDGELILNKTKNVPTVPMGLILNLWGDGGSWSGNMSVGGQVQVGIQWVEMAFNVSGETSGGSVIPKVRRGQQQERKAELTRREGGNSNSQQETYVCKVDGVGFVGSPEFLDSLYLSNTASSALGLWRHGACASSSLLLSLPLLVAIGLMVA